MKLSALIAVTLLALATWPVPGAETGKWPGVDETVVEKFAREAVREPREPFINTDQGDLLLPVFLIAGAAGGFVGGYYFHALFPPREKKSAPSGAGRS